MATELMKVGFTDHLVSPKNISQNKIAPHAACFEKSEFKLTILFTHQRRIIYNFLLKNLPPQDIVPHLMFIIWKFIAKF